MNYIKKFKNKEKRKYKLKSKNWKRKTKTQKKVYDKNKAEVSTPIHTQSMTTTKKKKE